MLGYILRSLTIMFTALGLTLSAISCSESPREEVFSPEPGIKIENTSEVSVNILQSMSEMSLPLQNAAEVYRGTLETPPSFHIQTVSGEDYPLTLRLGLLSGERIDLFHLTGINDVARLAPYLEDMGALAPWVAEALGGSAEAATLDGVIYGAPFSLEGVGFIVNHNIFDTAGIPVRDVGSYEKLSGAFASLREQISEGALSESYPHLEAVSDVAAGDGEYLAEVLAELLLDGAFTSTAEAVAAIPAELSNAESADSVISLLARMSPYRGSWTGLAEVGRTRMIESGIAAERIAVILESTGAYRRILDANPALADSLSFLPVYYENAEHGAAYIGAPAWWAVRSESDSESKSAAADFLLWLYRTPEGDNLLADEFGVLSPYGGTTADGSPLYSGLLASIRRGEARPRLAAAAPDGWGEDVFAEQAKEYFTVYNREWSEAASACLNGWQSLRGEGQRND